MSIELNPKVIFLVVRGLTWVDNKKHYQPSTLPRGAQILDIDMVSITSENKNEDKMY